MPFDPRKIYGELSTHLRGVEAQGRNAKYNPAPTPDPLADPSLDAAPDPAMGMDLGSEMDSLGDDDITALLGPPDPDPAVEPASPKLMEEQGETAADEPDSDTDDGSMDLGALSDMGLEG